MSDDAPRALREVQDHFRLPSVSLVEKDLYVVKAIAALAAIDAAPFTLVFGGGTALARAHKIIQRMSEDVDFMIVPLPAAPVSGAGLRKQICDLHNRVTEALQNAGFVFDPADKAAIGSRNENRYTIYQLPYAEIGAAQVLRPTIKIEMTYATLRLPRVILPVSSFVSEAFGRPPDVAAVPCVSMAETAAEKLGTAMDLAGLSRDADPALVRHIYDLHMMRDLVDLARVTALAGDIAARPMQPNLSTSIRPMPPIAQAKPATPSMRSAPIRSTACAIRTSSRRWSMASERNSMRR